MIPFISNLFNLPVTRTEILKRAKRIKRSGICYSLIDALTDYNILCNRPLEEYFPKFTRENALQFGASKKNLWWWTPRVWVERMDFVNWLLDQYKGDKIDLRKL